MNINGRKSPDKVVGIWLMTGVAMLVVQILLGGITRLTGSGLSITNWDVITGTLPPLNQQQWLNEFHNYQQTPQYRLLNSSFGLNDFKSIFFWEWLHRLWGRLIGFAFLVPFIIFLIQRRFKSNMIRPMVILFLLGALQGAVGWIMVASGLTGNAIYVAPVKLAMHFVLACILISYTFWFALQLLSRKKVTTTSGFRNYTFLLIFFIFIQLAFGALMAGNKAAPAAPTWPGINGSFLPGYVFTPNDGWKSILENAIVIHAIHRSVAYLIAIGILVWTIAAVRVNAVQNFRIARVLPLFLVLLQIGLGIFTVLTSPGIQPNKWNTFQWMAECHQLIGISLLLSLVACYYFQQRKQNINY